MPRLECLNSVEKTVIGADAGEVGAHFEVFVGVFEVDAHALEHAPGAYRLEERLLEGAPQLIDECDAVGPIEKASAMERIHVHLSGRRLVAAQKMGREPDPHQRQAESAADEQDEGAEGNGISETSVDDTIQVAVLGLVIVGLVATQPDLLKKDHVHGTQHIVRRMTVFGKPFRNAGGPIVQDRLVGVHVQLREPRLGQAEAAFLEVKIFPGPTAEGTHAFVGIKGLEVDEDLPRAPAQNGVVAQDMRFEPWDDALAFRNEPLLGKPGNTRVLIVKQSKQCLTLAG